LASCQGLDELLKANAHTRHDFTLKTPPDMRPPQTLGDWIFFLALSSMVFAMGVLFFVYPPQPIPTQRGAYTEHAGTLGTVLARESGRRLSLVKFRLVNDATVYESRAPRIHETSTAWRGQHTKLVFFTIAQQPADTGTLRSPRTAYGLSVDGLATRSLEADIQHANTMVSPGAGLLALGMGSLGYLVAGLVWWRRARPKRGVS
jgi:hypothetical protein